MSHFTVLVITDKAADVAKALAPFHEFECTGDDNEYIQDIDKTDEMRAEFMGRKTSRLVDPADGSLHEPYADRFYREMTAEEKGKSSSINTRIKFIPDGWAEIEVMEKDISTFAEWAAGWAGSSIVKPGEQIDKAKDHKYGYILVDDAGEVVKIIDRTNPRAKWDWWQVGGRWSGMMRVKEGAVGTKGTPGLMGSQRSAEGVDICRAGDLDLETMLRLDQERRASKWDGAEQAYNATEASDPSGRTLAQSLARYKDIIDGFRAALNDPDSGVTGPISKLIDENEEASDLRRRVGRLYWDHGIDETSGDRESYIGAATAFSTYAVVKDGQWYEKGEMGWWGMASNEISEAEWQAKFTDLLRDLPPEKVLTVCDCHI